MVADTLMRAPVAGLRNRLDRAATAQAVSYGSATLRLRMRPARKWLTPLLQNRCYTPSTSPCTAALRDHAKAFLKS